MISFLNLTIIALLLYSLYLTYKDMKEYNDKEKLEEFYKVVLYPVCFGFFITVHFIHLMAINHNSSMHLKVDPFGFIFAMFVFNISGILAFLKKDFKSAKFDLCVFLAFFCMYIENNLI